MPFVQHKSSRTSRALVQDRIESPRNPGRRSASSFHSATLLQLTFPALACAAHRASSMRVTSSARRRIPVEAPLKGGTLCRLTSLSVDPFPKRSPTRPVSERSLIDVANQRVSASQRGLLVSAKAAVTMCLLCEKLCQSRSRGHLSFLKRYILCSLFFE